MMAFEQLGWSTLSVVLLALGAQAACTPNTTSTADLQAALSKGGAGFTLSLCAGQRYVLQAPLTFAAANQEISTEGFPTGADRATLVVGGTTQQAAVRGTTKGLDGCKLRYVQIDGNRGNNPAAKSPSQGNIEMGGDTKGQLIEYVRTWDPKGWSCLHVAEGQFTCSNVTVQHNDIGPCGQDSFQDWADGISLSCMHSLVQNNTITDATDGGIVIFGAPFSTVKGNKIIAKTRTMLGGINLVDILPWMPIGNYSQTMVEDNQILGGYATALGNASKGPQNESALIKIGIAIGPEVWFGKQFGTNTSRGAVVSGNTMSGAFTFGMAVAGAENFVITNNSFLHNCSFIGDYSKNCTTGADTPHPPTALIRDPRTIKNVTMSAGQADSPGDDFEWQNGTVLGMVCFTPPKPDSTAWPYGEGGANAAAITSQAAITSPSTASASTNDKASDARLSISSPSFFTGLVAIAIATLL